MTDERPSERETSQATGDPLTRILRHTDTARGAALEPVEKARMRRAIGAAAGQRSAARWWIEARWMQTAAVAAVLLLAVAAGLWSPANEPRPSPPAAAVADTDPPIPANKQSRTEQPSANAPNRLVGDATPADTQPHTDDPSANAPNRPVVDATPAGIQPLSDDPSVNASNQPVVDATPAGIQSLSDDPLANASNQPVVDATPAGIQSLSDDPLANAPNRLVGDPPSPTGKQPRTVRFTAPRGTRIIWTLDPNFASPTAGSARSRQENRP